MLKRNTETEKWTYGTGKIEMIRKFLKFNIHFPTKIKGINNKEIFTKML